MAEVQARSCPGPARPISPRSFLHRVFELGAEANVLDPIWQVMPDHQADLPWTVHGDIACPLLSTERTLAAGDVLWVDTGHLLPAASTPTSAARGWSAASRPPASRPSTAGGARSTTRSLAVMRAGVLASELTAAAMEVCGGERPWMAHFYLGHGLGLDSAEAPYIGTDLGDGYDHRQVLAAGTVLVIEPIVWDEGHSGYRSENVYRHHRRRLRQPQRLPVRPLWRLHGHDRPDPPPSARVVGRGCSRRWRTTTSTCSCSAGSPTSATHRASRSCGTPAPARSVPAASSCATTSELYLLSTWDEGVPEEIPHDHLFGITWNPMNFVTVLKGIGDGGRTPTGRHRCHVTAVRPAPADGLRRRRDRRRQRRPAGGPTHQDRARRSTPSAPPSRSPRPALAAAVAAPAARA